MMVSSSKTVPDQTACRLRSPRDIAWTEANSCEGAGRLSALGNLCLYSRGLRPWRSSLRKRKKHSR